jgi:enoyl-CoA hydratase/carnithine racemase
MKRISKDCVTIKLDRKNGISWIILNRPKKLNAINIIMLEELSEAIDYLEQENEVRCIIIKGQGDKAFSSGADLKELRILTKKTAIEFSIKGKKVFSKLEEISKPVIAAINGYAIGGGLELALACDFRLAADTAQLGFPEINLGFIPAWGGTQRLPFIVGKPKAKRLIMFGNLITAQEASNIGLVDEIMSLNNLEAEAEKLAQRLALQSRVELGAVKKTVNYSLRNFRRGLDKETKVFVRLISTEETKKKLRDFDSRRNKNEENLSGDSK